MGQKRWHAGVVELSEALRTALVADHDRVMHWLVCAECDPENEAELLLQVVGLTRTTYFEAVMALD